MEKNAGYDLEAVGEPAGRSDKVLNLLGRYNLKEGDLEEGFARVCDNRNIDPRFLMHLIRVYQDDYQYHELDFECFAAQMIIDYLEKAHRDFLNNQVPAIIRMLQEIMEREPGYKPIFEEVYNRFVAYQRSLTEHIQYEEKFLFPYILFLFSFPLNADQIRYLKRGQQQKFDHDDGPEWELQRTRDILIESHAELRMIDGFAEMINAMLDLEKELRFHSFMEEKVLLKKAAVQEKSLFPNEKWLIAEQENHA